VQQLFTLSLPDTPASVPVARHLVALATSTMTGLDRARVHDLALAVSEACTNAIEANGRAGGGQLVLTGVLDGDSLKVRVEDQGRPWAVPARFSRAGASSERGRGLLLMRVLADDLSVESTTDGTTVCIGMHTGRSPMPSAGGSRPRSGAVPSRGVADPGRRRHARLHR
jgi:anti-sigma regulatory factor (Ser/Thr protein kinase)